MSGRYELLYPEQSRDFLEPFLPKSQVRSSNAKRLLPWVTLTFATSLDSALSIAPGVQTALSGPESKAMTHYLRSRHDAILIGVGTATADSPSLNCRLSGVGGYGGEGLTGQPRPVVIDPRGRWRLDADTKILNLAREERGRGPWVVTMTEPDPKVKALLEDVGGEFIVMDNIQTGLPLRWRDILEAISSRGIESVMIEGGAGVINALLSAENVGMVDAVVLTIAPTWLGQGGVVVSPPRSAEENSVPVTRLKQTVWQQLGDDCVLCGTIK